jgi:hypothetical protein
MPATPRFSLLLTVAFAGLALWLAWHHELWRDEMQAWLIARDSPDLRSLLLVGRYEGSPPLWHLLLRPLALLTHRPEAMQLLQAALAIVSFFLLCRFAPFSRREKVLLLFNYYLLFEYGTVCRQYLLGALLLGIACAFFPRGGRERPWVFILSLVGAALTSVYGLILAAAMAAAFWGARALAARRVPSGAPGPRWHPLPLAVLLAGLAGAAASMLPAPDALYAPADGWHFAWDPERLARLACEFTNAHFLLPRPDGFFWIPAWLTDLGGPQRCAIALAMPLFAGTAWLLRRVPAALIFYLAGAGGLLAFVYLKYLGFTRHAGFLFLALFFGCWLRASLGGADGTSPPSAKSGAGGRAVRMLLATILSVQAVTGVWAFWLDSTRRFSTGREVAAELAARRLDRAAIAAWPDSAGSVVAGWLDRSLYLPQSERTGSFVRWNTARRERITDVEALARAEQNSGPGPLVIVLDHTLPEELIRTHGLSVVGAFTGALASFEDYFVYCRFPEDDPGRIAPLKGVAPPPAPASRRPS